MSRQAVRCELIAVGTELLLGHVVDTNTAWLAQRLAAAGIDCFAHTTVGDNHGRIVDALRGALGRADAVIVCGGLGPTTDDITREALAEVAGVPLDRDAGLADGLRAMFADRGGEMARSNLRQAEVPRGARVIPQRRGTAPGLVVPVGRQVVYALPGVPHEMEEMADRAVVPDLVERAGSHAVIASRTLRTWGLSESALAEAVAPRLAALETSGAATLAFMAAGMDGVCVRITVRAASAVEARSVLDAEEAELRALLGEVVFGVDDRGMEQAVGDLLVAAGLSLGLAESLTGGLAASRLVDVVGASTWLRGSVVAYDPQVKFDLLGVPEGPVVCEAAAGVMAEAAAKILGADVGLSLTGVAGPTEQDGMPVGTVFAGVCLHGTTQVARWQFGGDRLRVRQSATIAALDLVRRRLRGPDAPVAR